MEALLLAMLTALVVKVVGFLKALSASDWKAVKTQVIAWVSGIAVSFLAAQADLTSGLEVLGTTFGALDWASLVLLGVSVSSTGSFGYDFKKAIDNGDTAHEAPLTW